MIRPHAFRSPLMRAFVLTTAVAGLTACDNSGGGGLKNLDWDLRSGSGALDTSGAALQATANRPSGDGQGILTYPTYQAVVARRGDTVASVAGRIGLGADELASYNALRPTDPLRDGETLLLPRRVPGGIAAGNTGTVIGGTAGGVQPVDVAGIATTALDRVGGPTTAAPAAVSGPEPQRHKVARGETAFSIARIYGVSAKSIADWNGLPADLSVREGQFLIIPVVSAGSSAQTANIEVTAPGVGSPTPVPPSASQPLPDEKIAPAAQKPKETPVSPDLGEQRTAASAAKFVMPVDGKIIRGYSKGKNDGIDISAGAGSAVKAAADGVIAAITKDTEQVPIVVIRHAGGLLTVYAGLDGIKVAKGAKVKRGQTIAAVRAGNPAFVHFEVRKGVDSIDPVQYLQ